MAPTYFRREPGIDAPTAIAAPHSLSSRLMPEPIAIDELKAVLRREALVRRDALSAEVRAAAAPHDVADEENAHASGCPKVDDLVLG